MTVKEMIGRLQVLDPALDLVVKDEKYSECIDIRGVSPARTNQRGALRFYGVARVALISLYN
jgi:hypothetical protein